MTSTFLLIVARRKRRRSRLDNRLTHFASAVDTLRGQVDNSGMLDALDSLKFDDAGLIGAIVQDHVSGRVLMFAYMNRVSLEKTIETGLCHFWSRSRRKLWFKGESSGHVQRVKSIQTDCDQDVLLINVEQVGVACHDGYRSCFYREWTDQRWATVGVPEIDPKQVYKS